MSDTMKQSYEIGFQLILHAGDAKSMAEEAIRFADDYDFEQAKQRLKEAGKELKEAHKIQTELIQFESNGNVCDLNILLVHAQDHLAMALNAMDSAKHLLTLNRKIYELEKIVKGGN